MSKDSLSRDFQVGLQDLIKQHSLPLPGTDSWGKTTLVFNKYENEEQHSSQWKHNKRQLLT